MTDTNLSTPPPTPTPAPPPSGDPWHKGIDAEIIGWGQNKGWKLDDPKEAFAAAAKQAREAERFLSGNHEQFLKIPKPDAAPADIKAFWAKLGAAEAKDYDLSSIKMNGEALPESLTAAMQNALAAGFVPKDKAPTVAAIIAKELESAEAAKTVVAAAKLAEEKTKLKANWRENYDFNLLKAMEGARRLGPEFVAALESAKDSPGYAAIMDGMRRIGVGTSEDSFVERGAAGGPMQGIGVTTREGARARLTELQAEQGPTSWGARLTKGDAQAKLEFVALTTMIDGEAA